MSTEPVVQHDRDSHRLQATVEGRACVLDYVIQDQVMTITHTGVPPALRGRGIAAVLVRDAFAVARKQGWRVMPACSYAAIWAARHPEVDELLA